MQMRTLGQQGPAVSALGLGLAALGRPGYMTLGHDEDMGVDISVSSMENRCHQVLDAAHDAGIRYFDVARSYGLGERFLASWLKRRSIEPGSVCIGSKWGYVYTANWQRQARQHEVKIHTLSVFQRQWAETRELLGDHLSLYMIHSATLESGVLERQDVLDAMVAARESTGVRLGLSLTGPNQADILHRARALGIFDVVQATWNVLEPSVGAALDAARKAGMGVIVKESLANGRLTARSPSLACRISDGAIDARAIATALQQPFADVVLLGAASVEQLQQNLRGTVHQPVNPAVWKEDAEAYWAYRKTLPWC